MSSASTGRYQSRLFNFLHRQSRRAADECERAFRHLKVASVWGAQILLYPAYLLVQTSRVTGRQLKQTVEQGFPQFLVSSKGESVTPTDSSPTPPPADTPIQQVLLALNASEPEQSRQNPSVDFATSSQPETSSFTTFVAWASSQVAGLVSLVQKNDSRLTHRPQQLPQLFVTPPEGLSHQRPIIQSVASSLTTRSLVLVTIENQLLDILTPEQQQKLRQRISWEVANYWREWRIAQSAGKEFSPQLKPSVNPRHLLPPVRIFWQVMAWVQTGPIASAVNLFQESRLVQNQWLKASQLQPTETNQQGQIIHIYRDHQLRETRTHLLQNAALLLPPLAFLDQLIAQMEEYPPLPRNDFTSAITHRTQALLQRLQTQLSHYIPQAPSPRTVAAAEATDAQLFNIQVLIRAAIDYFFGKPSQNISGTGSHSPFTLSSSPQEKTHRLQGRRSNLPTPPPNLELTAAKEAEPWLKLSDLFGDSVSLLGGKKQPKVQLEGTKATTAALPPSKTTEVESKFVWNPVKRYLSPKQRPKAIPAGKMARQASSAVPTRKTPASAEAHQPINASAEMVRPSQDTHLKPTPDWIETQATPMGYVKHPLEQILEWLDAAMLLLEELIMKIWHWVRQRL